jgi:hypothetical protein
MIRQCLCGGLLWALLGTVHAESVWHCSRTPRIDVATDPRADPGDVFKLAEQGPEVDVIRISLRDLIDAYSGISVRLSGVPLSACFMPVNEPTTAKALHALGLHEDVFSALARNSAIAKNHLYRVTDEAEMRACITRHQPAVGYLSDTHTTEQLAPCF